MNRRFIGNSLLVTFIFLSTSGTMLYFYPFKKFTASLHTLIALFFILLIVVHIFNNKTPLINYIKGKKKSNLSKFQTPLILLVIISVSIMVFTDSLYFNAIYNWGNSYRNSQLGKKEETFNYQIIKTQNIGSDLSLELEVKKGDAFQYPLFAIWTEDSVGNYLETLYISRVISSSTFDFGKKVDEKWLPEVIRRPESLPYWAHKRGIKERDGYYMPLEHVSDLDGVSGATPTNNFLIKSESKVNSNNTINIMLEVNQSYDWNEYYSKTRFPTDSIYSGSGQVGQPALIYRGKVNLKSPEKYTFMKLIGHAHHSGQNGELYRDLKNITTAKNILDRVIVKTSN